MERGARLSGSRFAYLRGDLVMLELALVQWTMTKLRGHGFEPVLPPVLVREQALYGTGFLPDTEQQIYHLPADDLYLVGTSEVALASMHAGEILDASELPLRYAGFSPCFRREAGRGRPRHTRHLPRAPVRQGRDVLVRRAERERRGARAPAGDRGGDPRRPADSLPRREHRRRRPRRERREEVRHRGMAARPGPLPRADVDLEHDRLPGPPARDPAAQRGRVRRQAGDRAHAQRDRSRGRSHADRAARERPARGRLGRSCRPCSLRSARRPSCRPQPATAERSRRRIAARPHERDHAERQQRHPTLLCRIPGVAAERSEERKSLGQQRRDARTARSRRTSRPARRAALAARAPTRRASASVLTLPASFVVASIATEPAIPARNSGGASAGAGPRRARAPSGPSRRAARRRRLRQAPPRSRARSTSCSRGHRIGRRRRADEQQVAVLDRRIDELRAGRWVADVPVAALGRAPPQLCAVRRGRRRPRRGRARAR